MTTFYDLPAPGDHSLQRSNALSETLRQAMDKHHGFLSFAHFMESVLYHPEWGYYTAPAFDIGKHGDFTTAPEISPLFARCFAHPLPPIFDHIGTGHILELGAGTGRFANDLLHQLEQLNSLPQHYYIHEISAVLRKRQQDFLQSACPHLYPRIVWLDTLPAHFKGVIIANELLDALPVHCFSIQKNTVKERCVTTEKDHFCWQLREPTTEKLAEEAEKIRRLYAPGNDYASEINLAMPLLIQSLVHCLSEGVILLADYGYGQAEYYHPERRRGTLTCFYRHHRHDNPLIYPGLQDITAHVDFTRVIEEAAEHGATLAGYTSQAAFLLDCGLMDEAAREEKNLSAVEAFTLHQAIKLLTLPTEMGERVKVMALNKNLELPLPGFKLQDRRRDL